MYKTSLSIKNGINSINILYTGSYKSIPIYYGDQVKNFKSAFKFAYIELNKEKLTRVIQMCKYMYYMNYRLSKRRISQSNYTHD